MTNYRIPRFYGFDGSAQPIKHRSVHKSIQVGLYKESNSIALQIHLVMNSGLRDMVREWDRWQAKYDSVVRSCNEY